MKFQVITLALADGDQPPTEFRLFKRGWNETENGRFLFDDAAARSVMAAYSAWGIDLMIDLEHQSLEVEGGAPDPTARDARGWCKLELRDGELWACQVRWTPDGARRLSEKTQRYVSPAFKLDPKTRRVVKMFNVAITARPATHKTPALVAASVRGKKMDKEVAKAILDAIEKGDDAKAMEILKELLASHASDGEGDADGGEGDGAEGVAPPAGEHESEAVIDPKDVHNNDMEDEDDEKKKGEYKAMRAMFLRTTEAATFAEALNVIDGWKASHVALATERAKLQKDREAVEAEDRRALCVELIKLGAEFPATVWADDRAKKLKPRWLGVPLAELRSHVAAQKAARNAKAPPASAIKPPPGVDMTDPEVAKLSAEEIKFCKEYGCEPKDYAQLKAQRDGATAPKGDDR